MFIDLPIFKLDYEIRDSHRLEVDTACVIVSNHQSCLDVIGKLSCSFIFYLNINIKPKLSAREPLAYNFCFLGLAQESY